MNKIIQGDCLEELKKLPENSIDLIVTDPPFGIGFMGKAWDTFKPDFIDKAMKKDKRPKIGIASQRRSNTAGSYDRTKKGNQLFQEFIYQTSVECLRVLKPGAFMFMCMTPRQDSLSRAMIGIEEAGFNTGFTSMYWVYSSGFPKASNIGKMVDKRLGRKREVFNNPLVKKQTGQVAGKGLAGARKTNLKITKGTSKLEGSYGGFQPKPAVEVIIVAMKPKSEKTYVDQALKNGKGITWLDDCRVPYVNEKDLESRKIGFDKKEINKEIDQRGRFPANLIVSDDVLNDGKIYKTGGGIKANIKPTNKTQVIPTIDKTKWNIDSGSFSRYFDLDKWARFLIVPKASKSEKNRGLEGMKEKQVRRLSGGKFKDNSGSLNSDKAGAVSKNNHPTVKPIKLMAYLITLGSRKGDIVLDPFVGSGTTCIAAKRLKRKWIGIEKDPEYCKIAEARIKAQQEPLL